MWRDVLYSCDSVTRPNPMPAQCYLDHTQWGKFGVARAERRGGGAQGVGTRWVSVTIPDSGTLPLPFPKPL